MVPLSQVRLGCLALGVAGGAVNTDPPTMPLFNHSGALAEMVDQISLLSSPASEHFRDAPFAKGGDGGSAGAPPPARVIEEQDIVTGLRVIALCPTNIWQIRGGMLDLLGAGWEYYDIPELPSAVQ